MRRLLMVNWLLASCWDVHTFVVPVLGHERGFSASAIGSILGAFAVAAAGSAPPAGGGRTAEASMSWCAGDGPRRAVRHLSLVAVPWAMGICSVLLGLRWVRCSL
jgi:hypothetical protein